jgi:hypothetical protein
MGDGLIEQRQRIAHRAFGGAGDHGQSLVLDAHLLLVADAGEVGDEHVGGNAAQIETLAARAHRDRHFLDLGGGEDEFHVFGGGSSSVFSRPLNACFDSMCTSSMMNTLVRAMTGL